MSAANDFLGENQKLRFPPLHNMFHLGERKPSCNWWTEIKETDNTLLWPGSPHFLGQNPQSQQLQETGIIWVATGNLISTAPEKAMAPHSSTLAWKIPWTEEPGGLQSMGLRRVGHDWETSLSLCTFMHWRRKWQPTRVCKPERFKGQWISLHKEHWKGFSHCLCGRLSGHQVILNQILL